MKTGRIGPAVEIPLAIAWEKNHLFLKDQREAAILGNFRLF
jgi:hypothetical protein